MNNLIEQLRDEAVEDGVAFSERRHARLMTGLDAPASAAAKWLLRPPSPVRAVLALAAAVALAATLVPRLIESPAFPLRHAERTVPPTAAATPDLPSQPMTMPPGLYHYAEFFVDQIDSACSIGRHAT